MNVNSQLVTDFFRNYLEKKCAITCYETVLYTSMNFYLYKKKEIHN